jgi:hypothetical protein
MKFAVTENWRVPAVQTRQECGERHDVPYPEEGHEGGDLRDVGSHCADHLHEDEELLENRVALLITQLKVQYVCSL